MARISKVLNSEGIWEGQLTFYCPACNSYHRINVIGKMLGDLMVIMIILLLKVQYWLIKEVLLLIFLFVIHL
jgi:hypothetical protein